jgi:hypothetical protein
MRRFVVMAFMVAAMVAAVGFGTGSASAQSAPPVANPGGPYVGVVGQPITISGAASTGTNLSFVWSFCDGTTASGVAVNKVFGTVGACSVTLTVSNGLGQSSTASTTANIGGFAGGVCYPYGIGGICGGAFPTVVSTAVPTGCVLTVAGYVCGTGAITNGCFVGLTGTVCSGGVGTLGFANCGVYGVVYGGAGCTGVFNGFFSTVGTNGALYCPDSRFGTAPNRCIIFNP